MNTLKQFPAYVAPKIDENLPGFLLRVAQANSASLSLFSIAAIVETRLSVGNSHRCFLSKLTKLSAITGVAEGQLRSLGYPVPNERRGRLNCEAFGQSIPAANLDLAKGKVCVECLRVDPYTRQLWDLKLYVDCHEHGVELLRNCSHCGHYVSWFRRSIVGCDKCGHDFRSSASMKVSSERLQFAGYIANLAGKPNLSGDVFMHRIPQLAAFDLSQASATFALFWGIKENLKTGGLGFLAQHPLEMARSVEWLANFFGTSWPTPFHRIIDLISQRSPRENAAPVVKFRRLYSAISNFSEGVNIPSFRGEFVKHLATNYVPYLAHAAASAGPIAEAAEKAGLITGSELQEKLGTSYAAVLSAAKRAGCQIFARGGRYPVTRFLKADVQRIAEGVELQVQSKPERSARLGIVKSRKRRLTKNKLAQLLGCSDNVAASILRVGSLGTEVAIGTSGHTRYVATEESVRALMLELEGLVRHRHAPDYCDAVDFARRGLCGSKQKYWVAHVIALIRAGYLVPRGIDRKSVGLRRILLSKAEGQSFLKDSSEAPEVLSLLKPLGVRDKYRNQIIPFELPRAA